MHGNTITALLLLLFINAIGLYDVIAMFLFGEEATVSAVIQQWSLRFPAVGISVGFVLGHLFWPQTRKPPGPLKE